MEALPQLGNATLGDTVERLRLEAAYLRAMSDILVAISSKTPRCQVSKECC